MKAILRLAGVGIAAAGLVLGSGFTAQANEQATGSARLPWEKSGVVYASGTLNGPNAPTKVCVSILAAHPYVPALVVSTKCKTTTAGTVTAKFDHSGCGKYATVVEAKKNNRVTYYKKTGFVALCG